MSSSSVSSSARVLSIDSGDHRARLLARRDALVESHLELVHSIARALARSLPACFEIDDLIGEGYVGLMRAATNYRPAEHDNTPFAAYARPVIRGAIIDSVRRGKWREATLPSVEDFERGWGALESGDTFIDHVHHTPAPDYETSIDTAREVARLAGALGDLPARQQTVVELHYQHGMRLAAVGDAVGVGASRASQLHMQAVRELRDRLA